jgi:hypothetical protein
VRNPENAADWLLVVAFAAGVIAAAVALALFIRWAVMEADAKHNCRASGGIVLETKGDEWHCSRTSPEATP